MKFKTLFFYIILQIFSIHEITSKYTLPPDLPPNANDTQMRILRGYPCSTQDYPFMVLINGKFKDGQWVRICGGSLLKSDWVLTAAHCFPADEKGTYAVLAAINRPDKKRSMVLAERYIAHPSFNPDDYTNDIALLQLTEDLKEYVEFVKLPDSETTDNTLPCSEGLIMGWGKMEEGVPEIDNLQCANVPMLDYTKCRHMYISHHYLNIGPDFYCTLSTEGIDACQGDSGGPLMCGDVQVGIVSWGIKCGVPTNPGVYTRTDKYLKFIEGVLKGPQRKIKNDANSILSTPLELVLISYISFYINII